MVVKVVDASAIAALLFGEPEAEAIAGQLGDARLVAPALLALRTRQRMPDQDRAGIQSSARADGGVPVTGSPRGRGSRSRP